MATAKQKTLALTKDMVEVRIGQIQSTQYGIYANLLLYQAPTATFEALDAMFGPMGWSREHVEIGGSIYCRITIKDDKGEPVTRMDVGTGGDFEPEKSKATDSFKRAAACFIPAFRALKKAPNIRIRLSDSEAKPGNNGRYRCYTEFIVASLAFDEEKQCFTDLVIVDGDGVKRFDLKEKVAGNAHKPAGSGLGGDEGSGNNSNRGTLSNNGSNGSNNGVNNNGNINSGSNNGGTTCAECGAVISPKVYAFSMDRYRRPLCMNCQKKAAQAA